MKIQIIGDNNVFEVQPGVKLNVILDELRESLHGSNLLMRRLFLDEKELDPEALDKNGNMDVAEFETLIIETANFEVATNEMLTRILKNYPQFEQLCQVTIDSIQSQTPEMHNTFLNFIEIFSDIFNAFVSAIELLKIDKETYKVENMTISEVVEETYSTFLSMKDHLDAIADEETQDPANLLKFLDIKVKQNLIHLKNSMQSIVEGISLPE